MLDFIEPQWAQFFERLDAEIPDPIPDAWRSHPVMNVSCEFGSVEAILHEMCYLVGRYPNFDEMIAPNAPTSIHHLYHLTRWIASAAPKTAPQQILEWGGGYGSLARLVLDWFYPDAQYAIVDHPAMHRFSRHFLGLRDNVWRIPLDSVELAVGSWDLFISTWALSESTTTAQQYVLKERNLFDAEHLLIAYDPNANFFGSADFLAMVDEVPGAREPTAVEGSLYLFR